MTAEKVIQIIFANGSVVEIEVAEAVATVAEGVVLDGVTIGEVVRDEETTETEILIVVEEVEVTIDGHRHVLPDPHLDVATLGNVIPSEEALEHTSLTFLKDVVAADRTIATGGDFPCRDLHQKPVQNRVRHHLVGDDAPPQDPVLHRAVETPPPKDVQTHIMGVEEVEGEQEARIDDRVEGVLAVRIALFLVLLDLQRDAEVLGLLVLLHHLDPVDHDETLALGLFLRQDPLRQAENQGQLLRRMTILQSLGLVEAASVMTVG